MKEKILVYYHGPRTLYLDNFPEGCERSCEGSLYIPAKKPVKMTAAELEHFKKTYPAEAKYARALSTMTKEQEDALKEKREARLKQRQEENKKLDAEAMDKAKKAQSWSKPAPAQPSYSAKDSDSGSVSKKKDQGKGE